MKKSLLKFVILTLLCVLVILTIGIAANAQSDSVSVFVDGQQVIFDVQPQTINDRTLVPIRAIFEKMGAYVDWDEASRTAICTKDGTTVKMTIDSTIMYIDNAPVQMDVTPVVIDGRTLAPARYVAEAYGANVLWSETKRNVVICTDGIYAYADYPDIPDLGNCYNIPIIESRYKDGCMTYSYIYSDQNNDDYYSELYDNSAAALGNYIEESQGVDSYGRLTITYTKPGQTTYSYCIYASIGADGDMHFEVAIPDDGNSEYTIKIYRTPTGKKYHYSAICGGKNSYEVTLEQAKAAGLTPCSKCTR